MKSSVTSEKKWFVYRFASGVGYLLSFCYRSSSSASLLFCLLLRLFMIVFIEDNQVLEELLRCSSDSESDDLFQDDTDNDPDFTTDGLLGDASKFVDIVFLLK
ncbi:hypothetical protein J6590_054185 [Homalodisca vitripennis]|nr:hypothetical protein J6590_054185 [Homalodisca vitripennis]